MNEQPRLIVQNLSTSFVQWSAREVLRRAQPATLVARFAPRSRSTDFLDAHVAQGGLDAEGALIDGDMGAYYTWLNQQRLSGAEKAAFLVWFEDQHEAVAIGPGLERDKHSDMPIELGELIAQLA